VHRIIANCAAEGVVVVVSDAASVHPRSAADAGGVQTQVPKFTTVRLHCGICFFGVTTLYNFVYIVKCFSSVFERRDATYCVIVCA